MKRAMTSDAKAKRAQEILETAYELYQTNSFYSLKMSDIAKAVGVSKGTLFNYFPTKESLFMEMLFQVYEKRVTHLKEMVQSYDTMTLLTFKKFLLEEMTPHLDVQSTYVRLSAIKNTILENNIDYELAMQEKKKSYKGIEQVVQLLSERVEKLSAEEIFEIFIAQNAMLVGYFNMANIPEVLKDGIDKEALDAFNVDFKESVVKAMTHYLDGIIQIKR